MKNVGLVSVKVEMVLELKGLNSMRLQIGRYMSNGAKIFGQLHDGVE